MDNRTNISWEKKLFYAVLGAAAILLVALAPKSAVNVDEQLHYPHAKHVVNWYFTGGKDQSALQTPVTNLKYYGQSVDNMTALFNRVFNVEDEFLVRHYTGAIFFWLLLLIAGKLSTEISGSYTIAVLTVLAIMFMPRVAGQAFGNLKDIPFAAGYMAGLLMIIRFIKEFPFLRWRTVILLGLAIAFTVSVRAGGFILFAYLGMVVMLYIIRKPFYLIQVVSTKPVFVKLLGQGAAILAVGYLGGLLFWPYALQNIFLHPFESLRVMEHYKVSIRQVFEGNLMWSTQLPWYYLPKWLLISSPLFLLAGFSVFAVLYTRQLLTQVRLRRQFFLEGFILFAALFPFVYVIIIDSNLYSGIRQMLFILPPMALLAVIGTYRLINQLILKNRTAGYVTGVVFMILLVLPVRHQAATFPVDYVYFNELSGGNRMAWSNYEYDYYFHSVKEPVAMIAGLAATEEVVVAMNSNLSNYFDGLPNITYRYSRYLERSSEDWDYGIFGLNYIHPYLLKNNLWQTSETIQTFYHKGNPVAILVKRSDRSDYDGITEVARGNYEEGIALLEKAAEKDPNNIWLLVHLARAKLELGDGGGYRFYAGKARQVHPYYEPLYLLDAHYYEGRGEDIRALEVLEQLFEQNPRYEPARELYEVLKSRNN